MCGVMIVSGESKTGQTHSRARSRRRVGESDASRPCEATVVSNHHHAGMIRGMTSTPIVVEDEDDDVVVSSPTAFAQAKSIANAESRRSTRQSRAAVEEDPLELRLSLGGTSHYSIRSVSQSSATQQQPLLVRRGRQLRPTIDLTTPSRQAPVNEDCVLLTDNPKSRKRKNVSVEPSVMKEFPPASPVQEKEEENKLKCAICMDTMKEETSTICGHLFCQSCIQGAIKSQKKCPTCRKKLTMKNIHRIYI